MLETNETVIVDLALATYLIVAGNEMTKSPVQDPTSRRFRIMFYFKETYKLKEDKNAFSNKTARVEPRAYFDKLHALKQLSFEMRGGEESGFKFNAGGNNHGSRKE